MNKKTRQNYPVLVNILYYANNVGLSNLKAQTISHISSRSVDVISRKNINQNQNVNTWSGVKVKLIGSARLLNSLSPMTRDKTGELTVRLNSWLLSLKFRSEDEMNKAGVEYMLNVTRTLSVPLFPEYADSSDKESTTEGGISTWARTLDRASLFSSEAVSRLMLEVLRSSILLPDTEKTRPAVISSSGIF